jgi:phosphatidylglycerol lysyltransferase
MLMKRLERLMPLFGACAFVAALWILHRELAHLHVQHIVRELERMPARALLLAGALTVLGYATLGCYDLLGMRYLGRVMPMARVAFASCLSYAFSNTLGPLAGAAAVRLRLYTAWGLAAGEVDRACS